MIVIKRNNSVQEFNWDKIRVAIQSAFKSVNEELTDDMFSEIQDSLYLEDSVTVEELQDKIEHVLFDLDYFDAAKSFMLYRDKHKELRKTADEDIKFIEDFVKAGNTADSTIDDNSNVSSHGIGVLNSEIHKKSNQNDNMRLWEKMIVSTNPSITAKQVRKDFDTIMYPHDSSSQILMPYCMACSLYPFLTSGLKKLDGKSAVPKSLSSFCGIYINLIFALASEVKGAVATPEILMYMDHFARKDYGDDYYKKSDELVTSDLCKTQRTLGKQIDQCFEQITYSINQVAGSRGMQSPFTNFSFFDEYFFYGMFEDFVFPDGDKPIWESVNWLQKRYLHWLNQERLRCMLTFPVCSYALIVEDGKFKDTETYDFICKEYSEGNSFFTYISDSVDSLSSCCRLQNAVSENTFNFTNGQIGVNNIALMYLIA